MSFSVTNLLPGPVFVSLATGGTVRLSPGQTSGDLPDADATNNAELDKLVRRGMVALRRTGKPAGRSGRSPSGSGSAAASDTRSPDA